MEKFETELGEQEKGQGEDMGGQSEDSNFSIEEIWIEELAVDGICGVY